MAEYHQERLRSVLAQRRIRRSRLGRELEIHELQRRPGAASQVTVNRILAGGGVSPGGGAGVTDHGALAGLSDDDHLQYELDANKGAVNGYAALDAGTKVPTIQLGGAGADATKFLRGDQSWQVPAGGGGGHEILDELAALAQRADLAFMGAGVKAVDAGAVPDRTEIVVGAYYDAIVDASDTNAAGKGNVYSTLQAAIDAGHTSIFVRNAGDTVADSRLNASMTATQTTVPVLALDDFPDSGRVLVGRELIDYTGKSSPTGSGNLTGATRGVAGTGGAAHNIDSGTATSGQAGDRKVVAPSLGNTSRNWQPEEHRGKLLVLTGGTGSGQTKKIIGNTATVLSVESQWSTVPNATTTYRIDEPIGTAVSIESSDPVRLVIGEEPENASLPVHVSCQKSDVSFQYVRVTNSAGGVGRRLVAQASRVTFFGVVVTFDGRIETEERWGSAVDSGTATSGGVNTLTDTTQSWVASEHVGRILRITSGTGAGQQRRISANTTTQLTVGTYAWTTNPDATSAYEILETAPAEDCDWVACRAIAATRTPIVLGARSSGASITSCKFLGNVGASCIELPVDAPSGNAGLLLGFSLVGSQFRLNACQEWLIQSGYHLNYGLMLNGRVTGNFFDKFDWGALFLRGKNNQVAGNTFYGRTYSASMNQIAVRNGGTAAFGFMVVSGNVFAETFVSYEGSTGPILSTAGSVISSNIIAGNSATALCECRPGPYHAETGNFFVNASLVSFNNSSINCTGGYAFGSGIASPGGTDYVRDVPKAGTVPAGLTAFDDRGVQYGRTYDGGQAGAVLANGNNNDVDPGSTGFVRVTGPTAAFALTGLANGEDARRVTFYNSTAQAMTVTHQDALSVAANRFITPTGATIACKVFTAEYSFADSRWIVVNYH